MDDDVYYVCIELGCGLGVVCVLWCVQGLPLTSALFPPVFGRWRKWSWSPVVQILTSRRATRRNMLGKSPLICNFFVCDLPGQWMRRLGQYEISQSLFSLCLSILLETERMHCWGALGNGAAAAAFMFLFPCQRNGREGGPGEDISLSLLFSVLVLPWFLAYGCFKTVLSCTSMIVFLSVSS